MYEPYVTVSFRLRPSVQATQALQIFNQLPCVRDTVTLSIHVEAAGNDLFAPWVDAWRILCLLLHRMAEVVKLNRSYVDAWLHIQSPRVRAC